MDKVVFSKYSNDRDPKFNVVTEIMVDEGKKKTVRKRPCSPEANEHVNQIIASQALLREQYEGTLIACAKAKKTEDGAEIEWIQGEKFSTFLDELYSQNKTIEWKFLIDQYFDNIFIHKKNEFVLTQRFIDIFGDVELDMNMESVQNIDIDIVFSNVIYDKRIWTIYDYEWLLDFPVPVKYLVYRCLLYHISARNDMNSRKAAIYEQFGIGEKECKIFAKMEDHFQRYVEGTHIPMWRIYEKIHGNVENVCALHDREVRKNTSQVFYDYGAGFSEENSMLISPIIKSGDDYKVEIAIPKQCVRIRFDPANVPCLLNLKSINNKEAEEIDDFITNGYTLDGNKFVYFHGDPQVVINFKQVNAIEIVYSLFFFNDDRAEIVQPVEQMIQGLSDNNKVLQQQIRYNEERIGKLEISLNSKNKELRMKNIELEGLSNENLKNKRELDGLRTENYKIVNSRCWRLTAPLRKLGNLINKNYS